MNSKFENLVQEEMQKIENPTLKEGFWDAAKNIGKNIAYGDQKGRAETDDEYANRVGWSGDRHQMYKLKGYDRYHPGNQPVIIDWNKNYKGFFAKLAADQRTTNVVEHLLKPTIKTFINGIDFNKPSYDQSGFFVLCAEKFGSGTLNSYRSRLPTRREAKEYDVDGVRYRMIERDFNFSESGNKDELFGRSDYMITNSNDYEQIVEWDKAVYLNDVKQILSPYIYLLKTGIEAIAKLSEESSTKSSSNEETIPPGPESIRSGTEAEKKKNEYENLFRPTSGEIPSAIYPLIDVIVDKIIAHPDIVNIIQRDLNEVENLLKTDNNYDTLMPKLNQNLGVPYYPNVSNDMLAMYFFNGMKDNFVQLGYSNIKNDLFFLPPDEINQISKEFRGKWNIMHPFQTYDAIKNNVSKFENRLGRWSGNSVLTTNMQ